MVPVLLGVVDILVFLVSLRPFILLLPFILPFIEPLSILVPFCIRPVPVWLGLVMVPLVVPFCMVPFCIVPLVVPLCMVPLVVPAGVVCAKAVVLKQKVQARAARILMVFMIWWDLKTEGKKKVAAAAVRRPTLYGKRPRLRCLKTNYIFLS